MRCVFYVFPVAYRVVDLFDKVCLLDDRAGIVCAADWNAFDFFIDEDFLA